MTQTGNISYSLTRRNLMVLAAASLSGCGGGETAGLPGTGGTGIYAMGSISGFGSVILNGIRFDDTTAAVQIDGQASTSANLRLGMVAGVFGERGMDLTLGTASHIEVWSIAQGPISGLCTIAGGVEFKVAGMTVQANSTTVLDAIANVSGLVNGQRVTVWGLQTGADGTKWTATRIALTNDTTLVSTGLVNVSQSPSQLRLNGLVLIESGPNHLLSTLKNGELVRVQGNLTGGSFVVVHAKAMVVDLTLLTQADVEIEGVVTTAPVAGRFKLGSLDVDARTATYSPANYQVTLGARLEVHGSLQQGVLTATKIELETEESLHELEIEARIEQFTSIADFVVRGQRCDASGLTLSPSLLSQLAVGVKVKVKGTKAGDVLIVTELKIDN